MARQNIALKTTPLLDALLTQANDNAKRIRDHQKYHADTAEYWYFISRFCDELKKTYATSPKDLTAIEASDLMIRQAWLLDQVFRRLYGLGPQRNDFKLVLRSARLGLKAMQKSRKIRKNIRQIDERNRQILTTKTPRHGEELFKKNLVSSCLGGLKTLFHHNDDTGKLDSMNLLKKPDAILFDWDGTLVDTIRVLTKAYNDIFAAFGMPTWTLDNAKKNIRLSAREMFPQLFPDRVDEALEIFYQSIEKNHLEHLAKMEGVDEFLSMLKSRNIPLGIISNKRDAYLKKEVEYLGWSDFFSAVVGAGRGIHDKPAPEVMEIALNEMGLPLTDLELWYVGDTEVDLELATNYGCKKVFISHGFGTLEGAMAYKPDFVAGSCAELGKELDTIFNLR